MTEIQNDIIPRLRACADGMGSLKSPKGDYGLCDDAADEIERLRAECQRHAEVMEEVREVLKPFADAANSYDPDENDNDQVAWAHDFRIGSLRAARALLSRLEER